MSSQMSCCWHCVCLLMVCWLSNPSKSPSASCWYSWVSLRQQSHVSRTYNASSGCPCSWTRRLSPGSPPVLSAPSSLRGPLARTYIVDCIVLFILWTYKCVPLYGLCTVQYVLCTVQCVPIIRRVGPPPRLCSFHPMSDGTRHSDVVVMGQ